MSLDVNGLVSSWNAGAERIKGYTAEEILGRHFSVFYTEEDIAAGKLERELSTTIREGRYEEDGWRVRKDGTRFWANVVLTAIRDEQGTLVGFGKVTRDITTQHEQARQLVLAAEELRRANEALKQQAEELAHARDQATMAVRRHDFGRRLANALEMAEDESEVVEVVQRSLTLVLPDAAAELLLADNSHSHLRRLAHTSPSGDSPGCTVDSPDHCPAARRAQTQQFEHSADLDACPKLRDRAQPELSAICVPVSIMGRTVGIVHATGDPGASFSEETATDLSTLANLAGARLGLVRVMAETQLQAETDSLTGMLNRRAFEQRFNLARREEPGLVLALADLDNFKKLNDVYGHETGDRALRLFARVLQACVRANDVTARHGGEEFAIAFSGCTTESGARILSELQSNIAAAATAAGLPTFTASFGLVEVRDHEDLTSALARADVALYEAKRSGRNRVVIGVPDASPQSFDIPGLTPRRVSLTPRDMPAQDWARVAPER